MLGKKRRTSHGFEYVYIPFRAFMATPPNSMVVVMSDRKGYPKRLLLAQGAVLTVETCAAAALTTGLFVRAPVLYNST